MAVVWIVTTTNRRNWFAERGKQLPKKATFDNHCSNAMALMEQKIHDEIKQAAVKAKLQSKTVSGTGKVAAGGKQQMSAKQPTGGKAAGGKTTGGKSAGGKTVSTKSGKPKA